MAKIPASKVKAKHIGIEIEFFSNDLQNEQVEAIFDKHPVRHFAELGDDGSVDADAGWDHEGFELRVLTEYTKLRIVLLTVQDFLNKVKAKTNKTCGLHVHLDMRNFDAGKAYSNLIARQAEMIKSLPKERRGNTYCRAVDATHSKRIAEYLSKDEDKIDYDKLKEEARKLLTKFGVKEHGLDWMSNNIVDDVADHVDGNTDYDMNDYHYNGISAEPLLEDRYKTLEVRFHEGTSDCARIGKWVKYLYDTAYTGKLSTVSTSYIKERIKKHG